MKKNLPRAYLLIMCSFCIAHLAKAQQEEQEDGFEQIIQEFPFMQSVYLQEDKEIQQTISAMHSDGGGMLTNGLSYEAEYGFTDWFQLSAGVSNQHYHTTENSLSSSGIELGSMLGLLNTRHNAAALSFEAEFPLSSKERDGELEVENEVELSPMLLYAQQLGFLQIHLQAGAEIQKEEKEWLTNVGLVAGDGWLHPLLEVNGLHSEDEDRWYVAPGVVVNNERGWEFIAGYRHQLSASSWDLSLKLLYEFTHK